MNNKLTYVFGHKNPDTDSVCAAIAMSYLKNKLGMNTTPAVLGNINLETKYALDYFGFKHIYHLNYLFLNASILTLAFSRKFI